MFLQTAVLIIGYTQDELNENRSQEDDKNHLLNNEDVDFDR